MSQQVRPTNEEIIERLCEIFKKTDTEMGWPRSGRPVTVNSHYSGTDTISITVCDVDEMSFVELEKVSIAVGSKNINFQTDHWEGGSEETPCNGTDITLIVRYK